jgi:hypothetical protein
MAVGMLIAGEGVTHELYVQLSEAMFGNHPMTEDQAPDGLVIHTAGASPQGFYVYDIWESKEHFQRFAEEKLMPAAQALDAPALEPVFYEIDTIVSGRAPAVA